ncbi:hypothetical protein PPH41_37745, partial [Burkholderia gladioli]|nr:hypothetical protein [Burkholderia gladioli]
MNAPHTPAQHEAVEAVEAEVEAGRRALTRREQKEAYENNKLFKRIVRQVGQAIAETVAPTLQGAGARSIGCGSSSSTCTGVSSRASGLAGARYPANHRPAIRCNTSTSASVSPARSQRR